MLLYLRSDEVLDVVNRLMDEEGDPILDDIFQRAFTLTALDRRPFTPPLESPRDRVTNMRNACERFGVSDKAIKKIQALGFTSVTLLSFIKDIKGLDLTLSPDDSFRLDQCVTALNNSPLEPLYSLKRYFRDEDPDDVTDQHNKLSEFLNLDPVTTSRRSFSTSSTSSSLSSTPESPKANEKKYYCPLFFCGNDVLLTSSDDLSEHLETHHSPIMKAPMFLENMAFGSIELSFDIGKTRGVGKDRVLFFGPSKFTFDGVDFYEIVYRIPSAASNNNTCYNFWLWAAVPTHVATRYGFSISLFGERMIRPPRSVTSLEVKDKENSRLCFFSFPERDLEIQAKKHGGSMKYFIKIYKGGSSKKYNYTSKK